MEEGMTMYIEKKLCNTIIIGKGTGQLGNQLIVFSHIIAFAEEYNMKVFNLDFYNYAHYFDSVSDSFIPNYPLSNIHLSIFNKFRPFFSRKLFSVFVRSPFVVVVKIPMEEDCVLSGVDFLNTCTQAKVVLTDGYRFRDHTNFVKHSAKIRSYFKLKMVYFDAVKDLISRARKGVKLLVGVHVRQGDYENYKGGEYFYSAEQYLELIKKMETMLAPSKVRFLVFSNGDIVKEVFADQNVIFGNNNAIEDMYSLAECDFIVGPPSTFSTWASFYGNTPIYRVIDVNAEFSLGDFKVLLPGMDYKYHGGLPLH
jgi:hypothetical protein